jgi:hypothetical protein
LTLPSFDGEEEKEKHWKEKRKQRVADNKMSKAKIIPYPTAGNRT